jgi:hypothetical protein
LSAQQKTEGANTAEILLTALNIIEVVQKSGQIITARKWHKEIYRIISNHLPSAHWFVLKSLRINGFNFSLAGEHKEEESIFRESL